MRRFPLDEMTLGVDPAAVMAARLATHLVLPRAIAERAADLARRIARDGAAPAAAARAALALVRLDADRPN